MENHFNLKCGLSTVHSDGLVLLEHMDVAKTFGLREIFLLSGLQKYLNWNIFLKGNKEKKIQFKRNMITWKEEAL